MKAFSSRYWKAFFGLSNGESHDDHHDCGCGCGGSGNCPGAAADAAIIQDSQAAAADMVAMAKSATLDAKSADDGTSEVGFFFPTWLVVVGVVGGFVLIYFRFVHKHVVGTSTPAA